MSVDQTDVNLFSYFFRSGSSGEIEEVISSKITTVARDAEFYNYRHKNRGIALIFNQEFFHDKNLKPREGTKKDRDNLTKILTKLDYDVRVYNDLKFGQIHDVLAGVSEEDHSNSDSLLICVMSHGEHGKIYAIDHTYPPEILWSPFTGDRCISLAGKPKLFFIQACRGDKIDDGTKVKDKTEADSGTKSDTYTIPAMADILVMYSTYEGYFSWRSPDKGSWFIQALCKELEENSRRLDLLSMLTYVNRRVAVDFQSNVPGVHQLNNKKQVCTIVSMLTRRVVFVPKKHLQKSVEYDIQEELIQIDGNTEEN